MRVHDSGTWQFRSPGLQTRKLQRTVLNRFVPYVPLWRGCREATGEDVIASSRRVNVAIFLYYFSQSGSSDPLIIAGIVGHGFKPFRSTCPSLEGVSRSDGGGCHCDKSLRRHDHCIDYYETINNPLCRPAFCGLRQSIR